MRRQAASAIETLKMSDSPAKKLSFTSENKENENVYKPIVGIPDLEEPKTDEPTKPNVAPTIKEEEAHEPLLQENPQRFVLFPIKYHDVSGRVTHLDASEHRLTILYNRSGKCTRRPRPPSGPPRRLICPRTFTTGTSA
jgi:hypothetical protein